MLSPVLMSRVWPTIRLVARRNGYTASTRLPLSLSHHHTQQQLLQCRFRSNETHKTQTKQTIKTERKPSGAHRLHPNTSSPSPSPPPPVRPPPPPPLSATRRRYVCVVEYSGSGYHGWSPASQLDRTREQSIAGAIEIAIETLCNITQVKITGSGRTDKGVHGEGTHRHERSRTAS